MNEAAPCGSFDGRVVIVTGGSDGIGRASALRLAEDGATVIICARGQDRLEVARAEIAAIGRVEAHRLDVSDDRAFRALIQDVAHRHGRLDGLVNNAMAIAYKPVVKLTLDEWRNDFQVNADAAFVGTQAALALMITQGSGAIVNIASLNGLGAMPGMASYSASKAAMIHFSAVAALEAAPHGVRINVIAPGQIMTPASAAFSRADPERQERIEAVLPMRRPGRPEEIASVVRFLLSEEASYITGACIPVDGGKIQQLYVPD
ncbi:SDR family NAD(P)-dependent oxidoreductase [Sphingomonas sp. SRS2]|uniref:SDR family NAD(P)-dependent oxidoreductase n=1 Tax=Sphingomonas sp. SRS2 TaxID=133190 RepID=UPI0006184734|nr:SDR family NAD(P)-dependent oxidoreductase [Sphingomonas sp. SRS2]KKC27020.1 2,5-dichloro-2,5-cyclohexadiene-1,4-diol dehydrogenase [Sphingomonas sp. SRS2]